MKIALFTSAALLVLGGPLVSAEETERAGLAGTVEKTRREPLRLIGMMVSPKSFTLFVAPEGGSAQRIDAIGRSVGAYKLVAFDAAKGFADFEPETGPRYRIWLPEGAVKSGGGGVITLPPLESIKGLVGLDEAIARGGRARLEKQLAFRFNQLPSHESWETRTQKLADLIEGKTKNIYCPLGGIDEAFAKKYGLTPQEVEDANWGEEVGREFAQRERQRKAAEKK